MKFVSFVGVSGLLLTASISTTHRFKGEINQGQTGPVARFHANASGVVATLDGTCAEIEGHTLEQVLKAVAHVLEVGTDKFSRRLFPYQAGELVAC